MKLGLYMATQWPGDADLGMEITNLCEQTRAARDNGFASIFVGQHFLSDPLQMIQAEPLIARLAAEGPGMTFGIAVVLLGMQNPVTVAEYSASLDWITDGNYILGAGIGYRPEEFESLGTPFEERASRFEEALGLVGRLWTEKTVTHRGAHFTVGGLGASIRPKRPGGCPIWIGGDATVAVRRAARLGYPWVVPPTMHAADVARRLEIYAAVQAESGMQHDLGQPMIRECVIGSTREAALAAASPSLLAKYESYAGWGQSEAAGSGRLSDRFDEFMEDRFIVGDEGAVAEAIRRYGETCGVDHLLLRLQWPGFGQQGVLQAIERVGRVKARLGS